MTENTEGKKWISSTIALGAGITTYCLYALILQLGEWFDLEAKVKYFSGWAQGIAAFIGLLTFIVILKHKEAYKYLNDVYVELSKVVWPEKNSVLRLAIGILIGVLIVSVILFLMDYVSRFLLKQVY